MPNDLTPEERRRLNEQIQAEMNARNSQGLPEFRGLTPGQMHYLIRSPFEEGCIVRFQDADYRVYEDIPQLLLVRALLEELAKGDIKLTPKGNLPMKVVRSLYGLNLIKSKRLQDDITKLRSQEDWDALIFADELLRALEMIGEKPNGELIIAPAGLAALEGSLQSLFEQLFLVSFQQFNLGYFDRFPASREIQAFTGYTIYLLLQNGKDWQPSSFYADAFTTAWPTLLNTFSEHPKGYDHRYEFRNVYQLRIFQRFLEWFGLVRFKTPDGPRTGIREVMATDLFRHVFHIDPEAKRPDRPEDMDIQIKQALFDAEMGGEGWVSNDIPPEVQDAFYNQIRAAEGKLDDEELVTIRSLMEGVEMPDMATLKSEKAIIEEIERLVPAYAAKGIMPIPPEGQHGFDTRLAYEYLTGDDLLDFKVAKPVAGMMMTLLYEQVMGLPIPPPDELSGEGDYEFTFLVEVAEDFLLELLVLEEPFDADILASEVRLGDKTVSRLKGLHHVNQWRDQFAKIEPLGFRPGPVKEESPFKYQFVEVAYRVHPKDGSAPMLHEGDGIVQIIEEDEDFKIQGAAIPGFKF
ncbi:hypothetical protein CEQ90_11625 [Lewinellaceae bacterium SD302]|nr:hypothetical protein CEQ90_11625 [Lewinellaceae bacterium SD302]